MVSRDYIHALANPFCWGKITDEVRREQRVLSSSGPTQYRYPELGQIREWLRTVDPSEIEEKLKKAWKISKVLKKRRKMVSEVDKKLNRDLFRTFGS